MPSKPPAPSDLADKFVLRMPAGMRDRINEAAKANNRSMNSEIVARLQESLDSRPTSQEVTNVLRDLVMEAAHKIIAERKGTP